MSSIAATRSVNQISPIDERIYHTSNLVGDWKGTWSLSQRPVEFKVINIKGQSAQVEYTHDGHTDRGNGVVDGHTITFGNVTIGTRDGKKAALEFSFGGGKKSALLDKTAATTDQDKLVGTWIGTSLSTGASVSVQVISIDGRDAQIKYNVNGRSSQGVGDVYKNAVNFDHVQISSTDGVHGQAIFPDGHKTEALAVTKYTADGKPATINKLA
jgi:hypothetical protein